MSRRTKSFLSPKALAEAIGVSESSVKRWADDGRILIQRTSGGHRRIPLAEAARFVRAERLTLADPASLGLAPADPGTPDAGSDPIETALRQGAASELRDLLATRYLGGESLASLLDGPVSRAMTAVGELWHASEEGIMIEHRTSTALRNALAGLAHLVPQPGSDAPRAVGGCLAGDPGQLASAMASLVLTGEGLLTVDLGADTPAGPLAMAAADRKAHLVWVSVTHPPEDPAAAQAAMDQLRRTIGSRPLAVGGLGAANLDIGQGPVRITSWAELAAFGAGIVSSAEG